MVGKVCILYGSPEISSPNFGKNASPRIYIYISPYRQSDVLGDLYSEKPVWDRASIFFVLQPIQLNILGTNFGGSTSMLRWVLRYLNIAIFPYSYILSITTLASRFTTFSFQLLFQLFSFQLFLGASPPLPGANPAPSGLGLPPVALASAVIKQCFTC